MSDLQTGFLWTDNQEYWYLPVHSEAEIFLPSRKYITLATTAPKRTKTAHCANCKIHEGIRVPQSVLSQFPALK